MVIIKFYLPGGCAFCIIITMERKVRLGISTCLLGKNVRYDGGHKLDHFLADTLGRFVEYVPVCPEFEAGFGVPREAMRLVGDPSRPRLVTRQTREDLTTRMKRWTRGRLRELCGEDLDGFIFKSGSPSSGMERVKVYDEKGNSRKIGSGLFAGAFMTRFPSVPVEDDGRLHDIDLRENFIVRVFAYSRWRQLCAGKPRRSDIVDFHSRHKYLLMAHSPAVLKDLGKLVARVKDLELGEFKQSYEFLFMNALKHIATVRKNANVLQHMSGYFKEKLAGEDKSELQEIIGQYRQEFIPLIVPVTIIRHYVRVFDEPYLKVQYFLEPNPLELKLRNHA